MTTLLSSGWSIFLIIASQVLQSERAEECHLVSNENYYVMDLDESLKREVYEKLRVLAQEWIDDAVELAGTSIYGIRR